MNYEIHRTTRRHATPTLFNFGQMLEMMEWWIKIETLNDDPKKILDETTYSDDNNPLSSSLI